MENKRTAVGLLILGVLIGGLGVHAWHRRADELPGRRLEATVYVPLVDNADQTVPPEKWHEAVEPIIVRFGGATLGAAMDGFWRDAEGKMRHEPVRPLTVSFEASRLAEFRQTLHEVGHRLGQEMLYVRFEEPRVEVLPVKKDTR